MKPQVQDPKSVQSHGIQQSTSFGIKSSGLHHILGILRNQLYSDKVLAVIREYTCNAVDAHTVAGCPERPIEVTFPNQMNPNFSVRDFGPALTDQEIQDVYAFYGESTKRESNDQIGMLGIGSKSAFAYGDNFVINSYLDGKKHTYNAFIDPSQVGQISKLGTEDTDEENGIEIVVPVSTEDADEFRDKGNNLFRWFKVRPTVKGVAQFNYQDDEILFSGEGWEWRDTRNDRYNRGDAYVVMGNIGYPIDEYALNLEYEDDYKNLLSENLILRLNIGDVEISASREKLQYTDHTRKNIKETLKRVQREIADQIGEQFGDCKTLFDAKCLYGAVFQTTSPLYRLKNIIAKHLQWDGKEIDSSFHAYGTAGVNLFNYKKSYRTARYTAQENNTIHCDKGIVVIKNDVGHRRGSMGKILPLIHNKAQTPYLLEFDYAEDDKGKKLSPAQVEKLWKKRTGFDGEMLLLSELPKHKLSEFDGYQTSSGGSSYTKDAKHSAKCFEYDFDFGKNGRRYHTKKSDFWKVADLDVENESGVYVIIDKFHIEKPRKDGYPMSSDPSEVCALKEVIELCGIKFPKNIYAFKVGQRNKIEGKDGWVELHAWAKKQIENTIAAQNLNQAWIDIQKIDELNEYKDGDSYYGSRIKDQVANLKKLELAKPSGSMGDFLAKHSQMSHGEKTYKTIKAIQQVAKQYDVEFTCPKGVKPTFNIKGLYLLMLDKYDMLPLLKRDVWTYEWDSKSKKRIENYVNVIDLCGN